MIIDDLDPFRRAFAPEEADSPLIVDPDIMLTLPVAAQSLKPVSWNCRQVLQFLRVVQHPQLPPCYRSHVAESAAQLAVKELLALLRSRLSFGLRVGAGQSLGISAVANSPSGNFRLKHVCAAEYGRGLAAEVNYHLPFPGRDKVEPRNGRHDVNPNRLNANLKEHVRVDKIAWADVLGRRAKLS
jgi:hypothetical protein